MIHWNHRAFWEIHLSNIAKHSNGILPGATWLPPCNQFTKINEIITLNSTFLGILNQIIKDCIPSRLQKLSCLRIIWCICTFKIINFQSWANQTWDAVTCQLQVKIFLKNNGLWYPYPATCPPACHDRHGSKIEKLRDFTHSNVPKNGILKSWSPLFEPQVNEKKAWNFKQITIFEKRRSEIYL